MFETQSHTIARGETLTGIAKRYRHKNWRAIWDDGANRKLKAKRRKPEAVMPGDVLVIPPTEAEREAVRRLREELLARAEAERAAVAKYSGQADARRQAARIATREAEDQEAYFQAIIAELRATKRGAKAWKDGVDAVNAVAQTLFGVGKLAKAGRDSTRAAREALDRINDKATREALAFIAMPVVNQIGKQLSSRLTDAKDTGALTTLGGLLGTIGESWERMNSPSFWAGAVAKISDGGRKGFVESLEGLSWNVWFAAVTSDFEQDVDSQIHMVDKNRLFITKRLGAVAKEAEAEAKDLAADAKAAEKRARALLREEAGLPRI